MSNEAAAHVHMLKKCPACLGSGWYDEYGTGDERCELCGGRGYPRPEECGICGEPMGVLRRAWKREGRPDWTWDERYDRYWNEERFARLVGTGGGTNEGEA